MHISDGVLPISIAIGGYALSFGIVAWSVRRTREENLVKLAVVTSSFFVASLVSVPLGPTSAHLMIPGIVGILAGNGAFLSIMLGVTLQSLLFQFGGITAIGVNGLMMGIPALACGWVFRITRGRSQVSHTVSAAFCGGLGVLLAALMLALLLMSGGEDFLGVAKLAIYVHVPVIIIEAAVSAFAVSFLYKVKPELLGISFTASRDQS
jgi:cobalt/nickel transport system permease protein